MQIETAVVEIYRSYDGYRIIADTGLLMDEAGGVFIYPDSAFEQYAVEGACCGEYVFLIRYAWGDYPHIYSGFCGEAECSDQFVVRDEVGGGYIYIVLGFIYEVEIDQLADTFAIEWSISIGLAVAFTLYI